MYNALFLKFLELKLESVVMDLKMELTRPKNLGLYRKYTSFELV